MLIQEFNSAKTCVNQVPAAFKQVRWTPGTVNVDYGGGKYETATQYLAEQGVENLVYDPFNRPAMHNTFVIKRLLKEKAQTGTLCNVLNVIKEPEVRIRVLKNLKSMVERGGSIYISCYRGSGLPRATVNGWQENRPLATYLEEVRRVFPNAEISKGIILVDSVV